jgi:hypothetical protein
MNKRILEAALILSALTGPAPSFAAPTPYPFHPNILLAIPSANMMRHAQYELSGRFQYFTSSEFGAAGDSGALDTSEVQNLNYSSEFLVGIENRAELGVQYGKEISFSVKALLVQEDLFWPDLVFGIRNIFGTQEGTLYGLEDYGTRKQLRGEAYVTMAKSFPSRSRVQFGLSVLNALNKGLANINAGVEQDIGAGAFVGYEVFERFSDFHQVLTLQWRFRNIVALTVGMTEFQSWIRQQGRWGFFLAPEKPLPDGYNSPGLTASLQVLGWVPKRSKRTLPERVAALESQNAQLQKDMQDMHNEMARMSAQAKASEDASARAVAMALAHAQAQETEGRGNDALQRVRVMVRSISEKMASDLTDPQEIRGLMAKIAGMGPDGSEALRQIAADTSVGNLRVCSILVMAFARDSSQVQTLRSLTRDRDPSIRREALNALVKIGNHAALEDAKRMTLDPDETVALAAGEAYRMLVKDSAEAAPVPAPAQKAPAPKAAPKSKPAPPKPRPR